VSDATYRQDMVERYWRQGLDTREIAERLHYPEPTIERDINRIIDARHAKRIAQHETQH
jgi:DNA-binding NarL/FixJ family response regulator